MRFRPIRRLQGTIVASLCHFGQFRVSESRRPSGAAQIADRFPAVLDEVDCDRLAIGLDHAALAGALPFSHGDPFDRILIAQARIERLTFVSNETLFDDFGVKRIW